MAEQCVDNASDRRLGAFWEARFCDLTGQVGRSFTAHQLAAAATCPRCRHRHGNSAMWRVQGSASPLPDVTVWTSPVEHHEIKHKEPTRAGEFGLEHYRLRALASFADESQTRVLYTIHDHSLAGGRDVTSNRWDDWLTVDVLRLMEHRPRIGKGTSWVSGDPKEVDICYWPTRLWTPLATAWGVA